MSVSEHDRLLVDAVAALTYAAHCMRQAARSIDRNSREELVINLIIPANILDVQADFFDAEADRIIAKRGDLPPR